MGAPPGEIRQPTQMQDQPALGTPLPRVVDYPVQTATAQKAMLEAAHVYRAETAEDSKIHQSDMLERDFSEPCNHAAGICLEAVLTSSPDSKVGGMSKLHQTRANIRKHDVYPIAF